MPLIDIEITTSSPTPAELSLTLPFVIKVTLRRAGDNTQRPCIFRWELSNVLAQGDLLVFHETIVGPGPNFSAASPSCTNGAKTTLPSGSHTTTTAHGASCSRTTLRFQFSSATIRVEDRSMAHGSSSRYFPASRGGIRFLITGRSTRRYPRRFSQASNSSCSSRARGWIGGIGAPWKTIGIRGSC
jgi:hypothetical protein